MSLVGKVPITVPASVQIELQGNRIVAKGPKGELSNEFDARLDVAHQDGQITVKRRTDEPEERALHGLWRTLINNMVVGVEKGFEKRLELIGTGYRVQQKGKGLELSLGLSHSVSVQPLGANELVPDGTFITVRGPSKQDVGEQAARIRKLRKPNRFTGKGIKYVDEVIQRKVGKKAGAGGEE